jgi:hypothetical protein
MSKLLELIISKDEIMSLHDNQVIDMLKPDSAAMLLLQLCKAIVELESRAIIWREEGHFRYDEKGLNVIHSQLQINWQQVEALSHRVLLEKDFGNAAYIPEYCPRCGAVMEATHHYLCTTHDGTPLFPDVSNEDMQLIIKRVTAAEASLRQAIYENDQDNQQFPL